VNQLFSTKQNKTESVSEWIQRVQKSGSKFREAAVQDCDQDERAGILTLADKLRNICFVQGLYSDRIQTIVRSRNHSSFDEIAETALEEESAIFSKNERYKHSNARIGGPKCSNCNKVGHVTSRCYLRDRKDIRVNCQLRMNKGRKTATLRVTVAKEEGTWRNTVENQRNVGKDGISERNWSCNYSGNESRPSESSSRPTNQAIQ